MLTRGLNASRGGGEACCKTGRRRRGALENFAFHTFYFTWKISAQAINHYQL